MNWLDKLPGYRRAPHGLEWAIWKRLPAVLGWGTVPPLALAALVWWGRAGHDPADPADGVRLLLVYQLVGWVVLHGTLVFTVAIGCCIVMLMKGPAYAADAYPPPGRAERD
jgi:hypothetical protein